MSPPRPLKVLHLIHGFGMGGVETWLMQLLRHWRSRERVALDFLLTGGEPAIFDDEARRLGARLHYVRYGRGHTARFVREFRRLLRAGAYDAVHDHADYASGWHFALGAGALPPVRVAHVHNPWLHIAANYAVSPRRRLMTLAGKGLVHALATDVCGTSRDALTRYGFHDRTTGRPRVAVVHCGFDVSQYRSPRASSRDAVCAEFGWPRQTKVVLFAGRFDRALDYHDPHNHKNSWFAVNVAREACARDPSMGVLLAGEPGPAAPEIVQHIARWGLTGRIRILGVRTDVPRLMRGADALLFPSTQEGLGMVAVEAQAAGLGVLASTGVPSEAMVMPELFSALPLAAPMEAWADALLRTAVAPRPSDERIDAVFERSAFSVANSARALETIYGGRRAPGEGALAAQPGPR